MKSSLEAEIKGINIDLDKLEELILEKWASGLSAKEIAREIQQPLPLVCKLLKKGQKAIIQQHHH